MHQFHIPQGIRQISHNAPFCNRNVHRGAHFCYKMVHCGIFVWCLVGFVRFFYVHAYGSLLFVKRQRSTHSSPWYILYSRQSMRYLNLFLQFINFNAVNNSSEGDPRKTPRLIIAALFGKLIGVLYLFYTQFLTRHYSISCKNINE